MENSLWCTDAHEELVIATLIRGLYVAVDDGRIGLHRMKAGMLKPYLDATSFVPCVEYRGHLKGVVVG